MLRRIAFILIAAALAGVAGLPSAPARAQAQPELRALQVSLWPEFDRPSMLIIYRITLAPESTLPANLVFRIPPSGEVLVTAVGASPNTVDEVNHTDQIVGTWKEVSFTATFPVIQFEYYDNGLQIEGQSRHFEYRWPGDYAVGGMTIEVQEPVGATGLRISPNLGAGKPGENGVVYYTSQVGSLTAGQELGITLDYMKDTQTLTIEELDVQASQAITDDTPGRVRLRSALPWALGLLGVILIFGGGWWYWHSGRKPERPERRRRGRLAHGERQSASEQAGGEGVYCHQCGKRAAAGDRFCRSCGTKLRAE
jgi:hypothetical protein